MTKLFKDIYYVNLKYCNYYAKPYAFIHICNKEGPADDQIINPSGKCGYCKRFIFSYKKLEVIRALKELTV